MKVNQSIFNLKSATLILVFIFISNVFFAQTDSTQVVQNEIKTIEKQQTKKRKDELKVFGGVNFNILSMDTKLLKPAMAVGWDLGASYKRGKFFYWQIGATYNNAVYNLMDTTLIQGSLLDGVFSVRSIGIPVTVGVNFLNFVSRIAGVRVFVSAVPEFALGVGGNKLGISMDHINTFNLYGQAGVGVDVAFIFVEAAYNYGFDDLFKDDIKSNPNQIFINLGFRF